MMGLEGWNVKVKLTKDDLTKIERWARAYYDWAPTGIHFWDLHGNDSLTYQKICKALNIKPMIEHRQKEAEP